MENRREGLPTDITIPMSFPADGPARDGENCEPPQQLPPILAGFPRSRQTANRPAALPFAVFIWSSMGLLDAPAGPLASGPTRFNAATTANDLDTQVG